jgi:pimeloyl-ACP methyl ester carboxylesterase
MHIEVNGARLWFDVTGTSLVPDGPSMRTRPTVVVLHGGPAGYDHTYLRPHLDPLSTIAQVVYVDLPGHGRSTHIGADRWSLAGCADAVEGLRERLGIAEPFLFGHSMGGFVALLHALRHPGRARGLLLQSTAARHDVGRITDEFRARFGDELAATAARVFGGAGATPEDSRRALEGFGPARPDADTFARITPNPDLAPAMAQLDRFDVVEQLSDIEVPVLVTVGVHDPVTPLAAARELVDGLPSGSSHLEVMDDAGHFPWLDEPAAYRSQLERWLTARAASARR